MATTMQPSAAPANAATNPQLKRIVYSKYRELLGSYNDKANAIIETLPAYMVREDRGFHCEPSSAVAATVTAQAPATVASTVASKTIITIPSRATTTTTISPPSQQPAVTIAGTASPATLTNGTAPPNCAAAALLRQVAAAAAAAAAAQGERVSEL